VASSPAALQKDKDSPCKTVQKDKDSPCKTVRRSPETPNVPLFQSPNKPPIDYRRLQPEVSPPTVLGLYELSRQREENDDIEETDLDHSFDDDEMSDITCSPAEQTRKHLSDESRRWKSELVVSASQLSLANMPQRYSSPARER
jgi:hypothetical protein